MRNTYIILFIVIVVVLGGLLFLSRQSAAPAPVSDLSQTQETGGNTGNLTAEVEGEIDLGVPAVKEFTVTGKNFSFAPSTLSVNKGDKVRITFKNENGSHDLVIDEFNVATKMISSGQSETVEFIADKAGTFEYYCSVGSHRAMGMKGTLTVK